MSSFCVHMRSFTYTLCEQVQYLYLSRVLCRRVIVSSRNAELFFMFNDQTDQGDETDGFEGEGIGEGGYEASIHCWRLTSETSRFTTPPAVEQRELYEKRYTLADFSLGLFAGFSLNIINFAGRISEAAILASVVHWKDPLGPILGFFAGFLCILLISPEVLAKLWALGEEYYIITHRWLSGKKPEFK